MNSLLLMSAARRVVAALALCAALWLLVAWAVA